MIPHRKRVIVISSVNWPLQTKNEQIFPVQLSLSFTYISWKKVEKLKRNNFRILIYPLCKCKCKGKEIIITIFLNWAFITERIFFLKKISFFQNMSNTKYPFNILSSGNKMFIRKYHYFIICLLLLFLFSCGDKLQLTRLQSTLNFSISNTPPSWNDMISDFTQVAGQPLTR